MRADLADAGVTLTAIYVCPHERDTCDCRKPGTGLFLQAKAAHPDIDFGDAALVGDRLSDLEAARRLGCPAYLVADADAAPGLLREAAVRGIPVHGDGPSLAAVAEAFLLP
jgi:histidinol-phosphate phosphatase family protein